MKKTALKILSIIIFWLALFVMALLAIPVFIFLVPIMAIWLLTDKILGWLERIAK